MLNRRDRRAKQVKRVVVGSSLAAAAGFVAGVLTAPQSGKKTRNELQKSTEKRRGEAEAELKKLQNDINKTVRDSKASGAKLTKIAQAELDELMIIAKDTKEKARELISTVQEGTVNDKDVKKAIKEANDIIEKIRKFIKK